MDPAVVSQRAGDSHGMLDDDAFSNGGGGGDGGARPAALKEEGEDKQRTSAARKGLQLLMTPASPIIGLTKKLRSRHSRGASREGLQALSGMDGAGDFVLTPVGPGAAHVGDVESDGDVGCAGSDCGSEDSGESVEEGGGAGSAAASVAAGAEGGGSEGGDSNGRQKRATKLARGLSHVARRWKKRPPVGVSGAMTVGRASLMGDGGNSYLRAHDFDGEGARSYSGGWGKEASSPESGARKMPQDWDLPMTNIPASASSAGQGQSQGQGQGQGKAVSCSPSGSRPTSPSPSPSSSSAPLPSPATVLGMPSPLVPPQMQRGLTYPCTYSSTRSLPRPKEDLAGHGRDSGSGDRDRGNVLGTPATAGGRGVQAQEAWAEALPPRGRPSTLGKSKSLSPKGMWGVIGGQARSVSVERETGGERGRGERGRGASRSASPTRRNPFNRRSQSPQSPQLPVKEGRSPSLHGSHEREGSGPPLVNNASEAAAAAAAAAATAAAATAATCEAKMNMAILLDEKRKSDESINATPPTPEEQKREARASSRPEDAVSAAQPKPASGRDCVQAAPPSELKYGDRLRLWVRLRSPSRNHHRLSGGSDLSLNMAADIWQGQRTGGKEDSGATPSDGVLPSGGGGYVGSLGKVQRVSKKLFKRSELAMIGQPEGNAPGFAACHFKVVDPENKQQDGEVVRYGNVVMLVDDRDYVWTDNAHLMTGSLRMKARGSKRQITVAFKPFLAELKVDRHNELPPVVFGTQGLQIMPVDHDQKDSSNRKRRASSRKSFHALTAFSKKNSGGSNVAGAFLCSDGRGEAIVFEVHLPNASPVGDPSPVVTKVTIHVDEQSLQRKQRQQGSAALPPLHVPSALSDLSEGSTVPSLDARAHKHAWPTETPTAPLTPFNGNGSSADAGSDSGVDNGIGTETETETGNGGFEESGKPRRQKSMVAKRLLNVHKRRNSLNQSRSGSFAGGPPDGRVSKTNLYSLSTNTNTSSSGPRRSSANAEAASGGDDEASEDGGAFLDGENVIGAFEGLKWGKYVQFKMPAEGELEPNDPLLSLRLSNRYTATLTCKQLRDNAGLGKFPVKASKIKGARGVSEASGDLPSGNGLVYLRCTLAPIVCPEAEQAALPQKLPLADEQASGRIGKRVLPRALRALLPKQGEAVMAKASSVMDGSLGKPGSSGVWPCVLKSAVLVLALVVALLSMSIIRTNFSSSSSSVSMSSMPGFSRSLLSATPSKASPSSVSPSPCTSVWDIRRPDGTAYPHNQLSAAEAVLDSLDFEEEKSPEDQQHRQQPQESSDETGGSASGIRATYPGGGGATAAREEAAEAARLLSVVPDQVEGDGVLRDLAGERADGGQADGRGDVGGVGWRPAFGAIGLAAVVIVAVLMKGLFGLWGDSGPPEAPAPSGPMQAQVHLLGWDGRRMSEAARATEDIDKLFYPPPSGSSLEPMPHRFLLAENMDVAKAWARWEMTLDWRKEVNADNVLNKPHPRFALIKSKYAHCFHLPDKGGRVTYYERPGMSDFSEMKKVGITRADLLDHYVYCMEYLWQVLQPRQSQRITIVIDLAGVKFRDLVGESVAFLKTTVGMMSRHYPQRSFKIMILNAPSFFNSVFAMVKPMLNEATKKKIDLLPVANVGEEMLKVIPADHLPLHYGGTGEAALGESPAELALLAHVQKVLEENGQTMQTS